ncbi:MAG: DUF5615 family PIN-like protein [Anaerolineae bacterium]|nr:DUF5615 family PIN-like protein [Anaerolineae bacterium]
MARLYSDEDFVFAVTEGLRTLGHDVLTVQEAGNAGIDDDAIQLEFAIQNDRAVVTFNRWDFVWLHRQSKDHAGIIACTRDSNLEGLTMRIHTAILENESLQGKLIRVYVNSWKVG